VTTAEEALRLEEVTAEITGAVVSKGGGAAWVVKVWSPEVPKLPETSLLLTLKW
jgi:hypothetical protein